MKFIYFFCALLLSASISAQSCQHLITDYDYDSYYKNVKRQTNDRARMGMGLNLGNLGCVSVAQLYTVATLFQSDVDRLAFCKQMYNKVWDKRDFFPVYDAFTQVSYAIRLYDYIYQLNNGMVPAAPVPVQPAAPVVVQTPLADYMPISYPVVGTYNGPKGANTYIPEGDFERLILSARKAADMTQRIQLLNILAVGNDLSMGMLMKAGSLITLEKERLAFMKKYYAKTYDMGNYQAAQALFSHPPYQSDWISFCSANPVFAQPVVAQPVVAPVVVETPIADYMPINYPVVGAYNGPNGASTYIPEADFERLVLPARKTGDMAQRIQLLNVLAVGNELSMGMLMKAGSLITSEKERLAFMKKYYAKTYDMGNYAAAQALFSHPPYQNDWIAFCSANPAFAQPVVSEVYCAATDAEVDAAILAMAAARRDFSAGEMPSERQLASAENYVSKNCLSIEQIKRMVVKFSFDDNKIALLKAAYGRCTEKQDYNILANNLTFSSSKSKLSNWLNQQEK